MDRGTRSCAVLSGFVIGGRPASAWAVPSFWIMRMMPSRRACRDDRVSVRDERPLRQTVHLSLDEAVVIRGAADPRSDTAPSQDVDPRLEIRLV